MRSYEAARTYFSILGFISWCVIGVGAIVAFYAMMQMDQSSRNVGAMGLGGSPPQFLNVTIFVLGLWIAFSGFLGLVVAQVGRAGVDTAEYTQQGLKVARDQLEVSRQALKQGSVDEQGYAALQTAKADLGTAGGASTGSETASFAEAAVPEKRTPKTRHQPGEIIEYRSKNIRVVEAGYIFGGTVYRTIEGAQSRIDEALKWTSPPVSETTRPYADQLGVTEGRKPDLEPARQPSDDDAYQGRALKLRRP